jgi:hypothetical protein
MVKHTKRKLGIFGLTWLLGPEGSPDEDTRTNSCSVIFFLEDTEGFVRTASGAAISVPSPASLQFVRERRRGGGLDIGLDPPDRSTSPQWKI